jgi:hypothetical protein
MVIYLFVGNVLLVMILINMMDYTQESVTEERPTEWIRQVILIYCTFHKHSTAKIDLFDTFTSKPVKSTDVNRRILTLFATSLCAYKIGLV